MYFVPVSTSPNLTNCFEPLNMVKSFITVLYVCRETITVCHNLIYISLFTYRTVWYILLIILCRKQKEKQKQKQKQKEKTETKTKKIVTKKYKIQNKNQQKN